MLSVDAVHNPPAGIPAFTSDTLPQYSENTPHTGLYIPFQTSGAIQIISRTAGSIFKLHVEGITDADCSLHGNNAGIRVCRLLLPIVAVDHKYCGFRDTRMEGLWAMSKGTTG